MHRKLSALLLFLCMATWVHAQQDSVKVISSNPEAPIPRGPLLNPSQLDRAAWFYTMDEALRAPEKVYKLSLTGNKLDQFPDEIFRFTNLQVLNLSKNRIKEIPAEIRDLPNLQILILAHNRIRVLPEAMKDMENLSQLYLSRNFLLEVPAWVGGLSKLRRLDVAYNNLTLYEIELLRASLTRCEVTH